VLPHTRPDIIYYEAGFRVLGIMDFEKMIAKSMQKNCNIKI